MTVVETPPVVEPAADWRFPKATPSTLSNGINVLTYHCPGQHVIAASMVFDVSLTVEPRELEGVAGLTGRCLTQGAGGRSAEEFADALALCGADLFATASPDAFTVRMAAPSPHLSAAFELMADAVRTPAFLVEEFDHEKRLRLQEIEQSHAYPQQVAVELLNAALFGDARVGRPSGGAADTVDAVQRADVLEYARRHLRPANATVIVAGDFSVVDPLPLIASGFEDWGHHADEAESSPAPVVTDVPSILLVDWPDASQATVRMGAAGISRADPRWPAMFVANFAVGGNFSSRINTVLREQKGVTYGASSSLDTGRSAGIFAVSTAVKSETAAESVGDVVAILRDAQGTLDDEEVVTAVRAATDSAALGFERADAVVSRVEMLLSQRLPIDHVDVNLDRIRAVTTESANAAYGEVIRPDALTIVVVGDAATLREPLEALGYADVEVVRPPNGRASAVAPA